MKKMLLISTVLAVFFILFEEIYAGEQLNLTAPDYTTVIIYRDNYGVPHIQADNESALYFGEGFAVAQDRLLQLEMYRRTSLGTMSEIGFFLGGDYTLADEYAKQYYYTESERQNLYNSLSSDEKNMFDSYSAGINRFLDSMNSNQTKYKPQMLSQLEIFGFHFEPWKPTHCIALAQYLIPQFGQFGGNELQNLSDLQTKGQTWFDINYPVNDSNAFTTIPPLLTSVKKLETGNNYCNIKIDKRVLDSLKSQKNLLNLIKDEIGIPKTFGSFAVIARNDKLGENASMLLGCPQMGTPQKSQFSIVWEAELYCPALHVGGMTIPGVPGIIIGRTENFAWTFTSGMTDNTDIFIDSTKNSSYYQYWYDNKWNDFTIFNDTIKVLSGSGYNNLYFTHYRTIHGPVSGSQLKDHYVYSQNMTFWNQELRMLNMMVNIYKAKNAQDFENALKLNTMSFNVFYTDKSNIIKYWLVGKYQDRTDGVDPRLPHKGDGSQEWKGFINFNDLPKDSNATQGYYVNWNNKPVKWWNNGDNIPWTSTNYLGTRVLDIENYVKPINPFSFDDLKNAPKAINDHGSYQQAIKFTGDNVISQNILPPGETYFTDINGNENIHDTDQWDIFNNWQFKNMIFGQFPLSVSYNSNNNEPILSIYPNPASERCMIKFNNEMFDLLSLKIFNTMGTELADLTAEAKNMIGSHVLEINLSNLSVGTYFIVAQVRMGFYMAAFDIIR